MEEILRTFEKVLEDPTATKELKDYITKELERMRADNLRFAQKVDELLKKGY